MELIPHINFMWGIDTRLFPIRIPVMAKNIQEEFLYKKTYEFSYATLMLASSAKNKDIAVLLESKAVSLLDSVLIADYSKTKDIIHSIISLAGIMVDGGLLHPINREVLIKESENIYLAMEALPVLSQKEILPDLNLNKVFSKSNLPTSPVRSNLAKRNADVRASVTSNGVKRQIADKPAKQQVQSEIADKNIADEIADRNYNEAGFFKSEMRQSAIINKLQEKGNLPGRQAGCRLNELQELFPDISERTLRYDIEFLISRGLVERVGSRRNSVYQPTRLPPRPTSPLAQSKAGGSLDAQASGGQVIELPSPSAQNSGF